MRIKFSNRTLESAEPAGRRYLLHDTRTLGLAVKVEPTGTKTFVFEYRIGSRPSQRYVIGRFGAPWTLEAARAEAGRLRALVDQGIDPLERRKTEALDAETSPTVAQLGARVVEYLERIGRRANTLRDYRRQLRLYILPRLGKVKVKDVTAHHIEHLHSVLKATPYQANRTVAFLSRAFNLAERWGWRQPGSNPTRHLDRYKEARRGAKKGAMLSPAQITRLLAALEAEEKAGADPFGVAAIRFGFWTGWRLHSEILRLRWVDLDLETGEARLLHTKTADEEYRSLPDEALELLRGLPRLYECPWVFPGKSGDHHLTSVRRIWDRVRKQAELVDLDGLGDFRIHDLRHNAVSWDVSRGVSLKLAGASVGHKSVQATEVYSHFAPGHLRAAANARSRAMKEAAAAASPDARND